MESQERRFSSFYGVCRAHRDLAMQWRTRTVPCDVISTLDGRVILISELGYDATDPDTPYVVRRHYWRPTGQGPGVLSTLLVGAGGWLV